MHSIDDTTSIFERATFSVTKLAANPTGIDQPAVDVVLGHTLGQHLSITAWMKNNEWSTVAGGEGGDGFQDAVLGTRSLRSVTSQEVITGLCWSETGDGRENTKGVASKHDNVARLAIDDAGNLGIGDVLNGVCAASVFGDANIIIVRDAV